MNQLRETARVMNNVSIAKNIWQMTLETTIGQRVRPGQFVMFQPKNPTSVLRRPFTVYIAATNSLTVIYQVVGGNTRAYTKLQPGKNLFVDGPYGQPVTINHEAKLFILILGGCGLPALYSIACNLHEAGKRIMVVAGYKTKEAIFGVQDLQRVCQELAITTDDGSYGTKGTAVQVFSDIIFGEDDLPTADQIQVLACGPTAMMKAVAEITTSNRISCLVSLEEMMGCATGDCKSCAIQTTHGMKHVCHDGPFFDAKEVIWL